MQLYLSLSKGILFLILFSCFLSCQNFFIKNKKVVLENGLTCAEFIKSIPQFWERVEEGYYKFEPESTKNFVYFVDQANSCFLGYSSKRLKKILGKPNIETETELIYYVTEACLTRDRDCNLQIFKIKEGYFEETLLISPKQY